MEKSTVRVAVIGVGAMGRNHVRVYADMPGVELVGIADADEAVADSVARRFNTYAYADYRQLLAEQRPDAVTIAVPTVDHREVALEAVGQGTHVLIEKPIAFTVAEGQEIIAAAEAASVRLMVGHVERFNPAVIELKQRMAANELGRIFQIDARRQGPFPARIRDVGVVIDLAVHDLDVMRYISDAEVVRVYAETERRIHSEHEDLLTCLLRLGNGTVGTLAVNWLTPAKIRELFVIGERGMFRVDYLTQDLYFYENNTARGSDWDTLHVLRGVTEGPMTRHVVAKKEPLRGELEAFLAAVRGEADVPVPGSDGLKALILAQAVVASGQEHRSIELEAEGVLR
jgi:predicted dehydrogenase